MNRSEYLTSACALVNAFFWSGYNWIKGIDLMAFLNLIAVFVTLYMNYYFMRRRDKREEKTLQMMQDKENDWK